MVRPIVRKTHNLIYFGPTKEIGDLPCRREQPGMISGNWRPSADEPAVLNAGGSVEVTVWSEPIPPMAVNVATSEDDAIVEGGVSCPNCGCEEVLEAPLSRYLCVECHKAFPRSRKAAE